MLRQFPLFAIAILSLNSAVFAQKQADEVPSPTRSTEYEKFVFKGEDGDELNCWLLKPEKVEEGKKYPLVLALHGRGGHTTAADVLGTAEMRQKYPAFVLAPAVSRAQVWGVPEGLRLLRGKQMLSVALAALEQVQEKYPIDASRIYVTGQSMGGFGSFGAMAMAPETFAAGVPICGGWTTEDAEKLKGTPIWAFHGSADKTVPPERSREMIEAIKKAGGSPKYTEYPGVGHGSWVKTYESPETWEWMFSQKK